MNKNKAMRLLGGGVTVIAAGAAFMAVSGIAQGLESNALTTTVPLHALQSQDRMLVAQADAAATETPVSYSDAQADRGEKQFERNCVECHGEDLKGGLLGGAPLRGLGFEGKYFGGQAGVLFEVMQASMPPDSPGRYSATQYTELLAYILKRNGFKAGADLPSDINSLYTLVLTK